MYNNDTIVTSICNKIFKTIYRQKSFKKGKRKIEVINIV